MIAHIKKLNTFYYYYFRWMERCREMEQSMFRSRISLLGLSLYVHTLSSPSLYIFLLLNFIFSSLIFPSCFLYSEKEEIMANSVVRNSIGKIPQHSYLQVMGTPVVPPWNITKASSTNT